MEKKKGNLHHNKNTARSKISSIPLSEKNYWSSWRKKPQKPNYRGTRN
jgi:hypothetical protein